MPWLGYTRVSRVGDRTETLISPELQAERIRSYASSRGLEVELLEPELDVSGGTVSRPILDRALAAVEAGEADGIIVAQLDRLSRAGILDTHKIIERLGTERLISVAENFDAGTPEGRLGRNVFLAFGEMQLDRYKAQFASAKAQAVDRGIWPVPRVPRGYVKDPETRRLAVDTAEAPRIARAFEMRAAGKSWNEIADYLECGTSGAAKIVRNRVYTGELRVQLKDGALVNPNAHPAIVDLDLFQAAQIKHPRPGRSSGPPALLGGLVRCAGCRRLMSPDADGYSCSPRNKTVGRCPGPAYISRRLLEPYVEAVVLSYLSGIDYRTRARSDELESAQRALAEAEAELQVFQQGVEAAGVGIEHVAGGIRSRVEAVEEAQRALGQARARSESITEVGSLIGLWPQLGVSDRRHVLRSALGVVWVKRGRGIEGRVRIIEIGSEPRDLSRPGVSPAMAPVEWPDDDLDGEIRPLSEDALERRSGAGS